MVKQTNKFSSSGILAKRIIVAVIIGCISSSAAMAGPKPKQSKPTSASEITKLFSGHSWKWNDGGSYWGKDKSFAGIFKESVGIGTWTVTTGKICYNATWYWRDSGLKKKKIKNCWRHVTDKNGDIWRRHHKKNDWSKHTGKRFTKGNKFRSKISIQKRKLGV